VQRTLGKLRLSPAPPAATAWPPAHLGCAPGILHSIAGALLDVAGILTALLQAGQGKKQAAGNRIQGWVAETASAGGWQTPALPAARGIQCRPVRALPVPASTAHARPAAFLAHTQARLQLGSS
jgi:hypothetical protein